MHGAALLIGEEPMAIRPYTTLCADERIVLLTMTGTDYVQPVGEIAASARMRICITRTALCRMRQAGLMVMQSILAWFASRNLLVASACQTLTGLPVPSMLAGFTMIGNFGANRNGASLKVGRA